jgi:hypothetical protein
MGLNPYTAWVLFWQVMAHACNPFAAQQPRKQGDKE